MPDARSAFPLDPESAAKAKNSKRGKKVTGLDPARRRAAAPVDDPGFAFLLSP